ncbi:MAG: murein biosynthesis integral membrane protein MurJ, partial [candidate division WOR-3 bacterium]|nr:murein biosynthesis integral membrane protein MurJ [candidate division WOR-3 bacterium]
LIARTIGYLRNVAVAVLFGLSYQTDGLLMALPLLGIFLIFVNVFDSLGVPQLVKARMQSEKEFKNLAGLLFTFTLALGLLLSVLAIVLIDLVLIIPAGFGSQALESTKSPYVLLIPYLFSNFIFHHFGAVLRSQRRFTHYFLGELVISIANFVSLVLGYYLVKDFRVIPASISLAHMLGALYMLYVGREFVHLRFYEVISSTTFPNLTVRQGSF